MIDNHMDVRASAELQHSHVKAIVFAVFIAMLAWTIAAARTDTSRNDVTLDGANVVPSVATDASGHATINIGPDNSVTGTMSTSNIVGTAAHLHHGVTGENGATIVTLAKTGDELWAVPAGVVLTDAQAASYQAGELYIDVHSAQYPNGELRAQLAP